MFRQALFAAAEVWDYCASAARRIVIPNILVRVDEPNPNASCAKWVVLCCHETTPRPDLTGLLAAFKSRNYGVVLASSNASTEQYAALADLVVRVAPLGRDFTAYQQAFRHLHSSGRLRDGGALIFVNDSVWFFRKYHAQIVDRVDAAVSEGALVCGSMIVDEVPHVSGWLFGAPSTRELVTETATLFDRDFRRKSRRYHVREGEHQILPTLSSVSGIRNLDLPSKMPAVPQGYSAIMQGTPCFYLKADSAFRVDNAYSRMAEFLAANSTGREGDEALRWLARRSDILHRNKLRLLEMRAYRRNYFQDR